MPDFLVIGAPKAGTTALHAALARHPGSTCRRSRSRSSSCPTGRRPPRGGPGDALTYREHVWRRPDYEALFDAAPPGTLRGESTPLYLYDRAAMRRIRAKLPGARLIVVVRIRSTGPLQLDPPVVRGPRARRRLRPRLRLRRNAGSRPAGPASGTTPRLGGLRRAARVPVHAVPARAGPGAALPRCWSTSPCRPWTGSASSSACTRAC